MIECETWYELAGRPYNQQRFTLPLAELRALRRATQAIRQRNPEFHVRISRRPAAFAAEAAEQQAVA